MVISKFTTGKIQAGQLPERLNFFKFFRNNQISVKSRKLSTFRCTKGTVLEGAYSYWHNASCHVKNAPNEHAVFIIYPGCSPGGTHAQVLSVLDQHCGSYLTQKVLCSITSDFKLQTQLLQLDLKLYQSNSGSTACQMVKLMFHGQKQKPWLEK